MNYFIKHYSYFYCILAARKNTNNSGKNVDDIDINDNSEIDDGYDIMIIWSLFHPISY